MAATFSADAELQRTVADLKISISAFWALSDFSVSQSHLQQSINGKRDLDTRTQASQVLQLCKELRALCESIPVLLNWSRDLSNIRALLQQRRDEKDQKEFLKRQQARIESLRSGQ